MPQNMKNAVIIALLFFSMLFLVPLAWSKIFPASNTGIFASSNNQAVYSPPENFRLLLTETGEIIEISTLDYLIGCLFAQIAPGYHIEALKAQAAAAHTYALRITLNNQKDNNNQLGGADISDNSVTCQPFFTIERAREHYGTQFVIFYDKIRQAAEYGASQIILHNNEPIYAVYHSVSAGATNTARYIWGVDFPYLQSVPSDWDREFLNFNATNEISTSDMRRLLLSFDQNIIMPLDYAQWFSEYAADNTGYVMAVSARNLTLSGGDLWRLLNLRSTAFRIEFRNGVFIAITQGHGHGAGLSQFGADYMAQRGHTAEQILNYYYTNIEIKDLH
jgi:stage II sporulation protein D